MAMELPFQPRPESKTVREDTTRRDSLEQVDILVRLVDPGQFWRILELVRVTKDARPLPVHPRLVGPVQLDKVGRREHLAERSRVAQDFVPDRLELVRPRRPSAACQERAALRSDLEVIARERAFTAGARMVRAKVSLVGCLVLADCG